MDKILEKQLHDSMFIHVPMQVDETNSMETINLKKEVADAVTVWDGKSLAPWTFDGEGAAEVKDGVLVLHTKSRAEHWPEEEVRSVDVQSGDYATFGSYIAHLDVHDLELSHCNRIWFKVRPKCNGLHSPIIRVGFTNNGNIKIPDAYSREGFNAINLKNHEWNICTWEIDSIAHDKIGELSFNIHRYGKEVSSSDDLDFELCDIQLQEIKDLNVVHGWECKSETAVFCTTGYWRNGTKTAVANTACKTFEIVDVDTGKVAFRGPIETVTNKHGTFQTLDFTALQVDGSYRIRMGSYESDTFRIGNDVAESTVWKLINFLFSERCGFPVPGKHGTCHGDVIAHHNGIMMNFQGGWHDAADVSQQTVQTAEVVDSILRVAESVKGKDHELYSRLMEEANWGLDFVLRSRFGDGYRATGAAIRRWTDSFIGNMDDCDARVHNGSFENFVMSGVQANAGRVFSDADRELSWKCIDAAKEDYHFALERFKKVGVEVPYMREHTANASVSQYYSAACWAAAQIYRVTENESYAVYCADFANKLLSCQDTGEAGLEMKGFFYRDESKKELVHFSHQSREYIFMQALTAACEVLPDHADKAKWENAMKLYGNYLKKLMQYTAPYGMIPAGIYHESEAENKETFLRVHPTVDFERERKNYIEQLHNGISLGNGYYVKCFAVWFSYRGNSAIHMSMGKAATLLGNYFHDETLLDIGREQLYWTLGKNPFGQSIIYGEGSHFGQQYTALLGETVGEIPVGVQTRGNEDLPYWPQANIATYREVWTTPVGRWLWIAADLMK